MGLSYSGSHRISADQYWVQFDEHLFQQYRQLQQLRTPPHAPSCAQLASAPAPCSGAILLLQRFLSLSATWFSSLERPASCLPSTAEHGYLQEHLTNGDLSYWFLHPEMGAPPLFWERDPRLLLLSLSQTHHPIPAGFTGSTSSRSDFRLGLPFYAMLLHREEHHHMPEN